MRPVIRRLAVIALLLGAGGILAACGTAGLSTTATVARTASTTGPGPSVAGTPGAPSGVEKLLTKRQAIAFAHAVNLTAADVPGFKAATHEHEHETAAEKRLEHQG
jgi:hypothetical protein